MSKASFQVYFHGPDVEFGRMDVRDLAPALLAIGSLLEETNRVLNGQRAQISVKVKKDFKEGSFGISFDVVQDLANQLLAMFSSDSVDGALNLLEILGLTIVGKTGLFGLLKWARGRKAKRAKILENGNVEIDFSDESKEVPPKVFKVFKDLNVRREIEKILKPLERHGIKRFEVRSKKEVVETIESNEVPYFRSPEIEDEQIEEHESTATFSITSLSFKEDNKWRLSDGTNTFYVTITDRDFLHQVDDNLKSFSKGDLLKVKLKTTTWQTTEGLRTEYEALEIIEHFVGARQLRLHLDFPKKED